MFKFLNPQDLTTARSVMRDPTYPQPAAVLERLAGNTNQRACARQAEITSSQSASTFGLRFCCSGWRRSQSTDSRTPMRNGFWHLNPGTKALILDVSNTPGWDLSPLRDPVICGAMLQIKSVGT